MSGGNIEVIEGLAPPTLTTVSAVKRRLRLSGDTDDGLIGDLLAEASAEVVSYCRRPFARARVVERGIKPDGGDLILALTPVVEVHSVTRGGEPILDFRVDDAGAGIITASGGLLSEGEARWWNDPFLGAAGESYDVEYTGGYLTPGEPGGDGVVPPRTLPHDIEGAVIRMVAMALPRADGDEPALKSIKVEDITYQYAEARSEIGEAALSITDRLDRWRRIA